MGKRSSFDRAPRDYYPTVRLWAGHPDREGRMSAICQFSIPGESANG